MSNPSTVNQPVFLRFELLCDASKAPDIIRAAIAEHGAYDETRAGKWCFDVAAPPKGQPELDRRREIEKWLAARGCKAAVSRFCANRLYSLVSTLDDEDAT